MHLGQGLGRPSEVGPAPLPSHVILPCCFSPAQPQRVGYPSRTDQMPQAQARVTGSACRASHSHAEACTTAHGIHHTTAAVQPWYHHDAERGAARVCVPAVPACAQLQDKFTLVVCAWRCNAPSTAYCLGALLPTVIRGLAPSRSCQPGVLSTTRVTLSQYTLLYVRQSHS